MLWNRWPGVARYLTQLEGLDRGRTRDISVMLLHTSRFSFASGFGDLRSSACDTAPFADRIINRKPTNLDESADTLVWNNNIFIVAMVVGASFRPRY